MLGLMIDKNDLSFSIDNNDSIGRGLQQAPKLLLSCFGTPQGRLRFLKS